MEFALRFPAREVKRWSEKYDAEGLGDAIATDIGRSASRNGFLTLEQFLALANWKSPRTRPRCKKNSADFVRDVTGASLASKNERLKIEILTLLSGVQWPTASVILHFCARDYPILDFRALWSLSCVAQPTDYDFNLWWRYCEATRELASQCGVTMRVLDRALWQYSKENQPAT